jgi:hypothetical protein
MNSLWIAAARIVRKKRVARYPLFHPRSRTCRPQVFPARGTPQVDARMVFFALSEQLSLLY